MIGKGVFEVEVEGKKVGFEFCMLASVYTEEEAGMPIGKVNEQIAEGYVKPIFLFFYGAAKAYNEFRKLGEVTFEDFTRQIDLIGFEKMTEIYLKAIAQPKNGLAPKPEAEVGQIP